MRLQRDDNHLVFRVPSGYLVGRDYRACLIAVILLFEFCTGVMPPNVAAQDQVRNPYVTFHNMQTFERDGETVRALRVPVYITLRSWQEHTMGLRLRLAATVAASDLFDFLDQNLTEIRVLSIVPGMELVFPFGRTHVLRPFVDAGLGTNNATDDLTFLAAAGLRAEFVFPHGKYIFGLEPGSQLSFNTSGNLKDESVFSPFVTLTARRPLGWMVSGYEMDAGVYFDGGYDFQSFELTSITTSSDDVDRNLEAGLGLGFSKGRPRVFGLIGVPRIRVGYRFGDVKGFRIRVGGDWLKPVAD